MFVCRRNYNITLSVFNFHINFHKKLHNLKSIHWSCIVFERKLEDVLTKHKMSNFNSKRSNKNFPQTERKPSSSTNRNTGTGGLPSVSRVQKGTNKCGTSDKESIDISKNAGKLNPHHSGKHAHKRESSCHQELTNVKMYNNTNNYNNVRTQFQTPGSSCMRNMPCYSNFHQNVVLSNFGHAFYRSVPDPPVRHHNLHYVCFNSNEKGISTKEKNCVKTTTGTAPQTSVPRAWELTALGRILEKKNGGRNPGVTFKVMSYNVLAQDLLQDHPELYRGNDAKALQWGYRWQKLYHEIKEHDCEILCLQEVQHDHIETYFSLLESLGYSVLYKQRTGGRTDGCAIYYKKALFKLVEYATVEYRQPNTPLLDRDNVAIIAKFAPKNNASAEIVVATTHLLYNPKREDVRLAQIQVLLTEIDRIAHRGLVNGFDEYLPIVMTGDFNCEPTSPVYEFITKGRFRYENVGLRSSTRLTGKVLIPPFLNITDECQHAILLNFRKTNVKVTRSDEQNLISLQNSERKKVIQNVNSSYKNHKFATGILTHNFPFKTVYKHKVRDDNEGTTYQNAWVTVDYIFYSEMGEDSRKVKDHKLKLLSRYSLPTSQQLVNTRIPNVNLGSDHLALLAKFKLEY